MTRTMLKKHRQQMLLDEINKNPFLKDDELSDKLNVSVATIRLYRTELGISEYRERIRTMAKEKKSTLDAPIGDVIDINLYHDGISILDTDSSMTYDGTDIVKGQVIFAFAEDLAMSVIDAKAALIAVANVKYKSEVHAGDRLLAKFEVIRTENSQYIIWVKIKVKSSEVFRAKFKLKTR